MNLLRTLGLVLILAALAAPARAATEADAKAAIDAAKAEEAKAIAAQAAWTPTEDALAAAQKALAAGQFDQAAMSANTALALAKRSVEQASEQKTLWQDAVIR